MPSKIRQNKYLKTDKAYGIFLMLVAALFFSLMGLSAKLAMARVGFLQVSFFRSLVTVVLIVPYMVRKKISFLGKNRLALFTRGLAGFLAMALGFYMVGEIHLADASVLNQSSPIWVALLSLFILEERASLSLIGLIFLGFAGVIFVVKPDVNFWHSTSLAGVLAGFFGGVAYVSIKKLHNTDSHYTIVFYFSFLSTLLSLLGVFSFHTVNTSDFLCLIGTGLFGTVAQLAMTESYKYAPATVLSPFCFVTVVFANVWGIFLWNERPDAWAFFGTALIVSSGVGIVRLKERQSPSIALETQT
jgi:drug/metabolite transporter (DMT)-like permease